MAVRADPRVDRLAGAIRVGTSTIARDRVARAEAQHGAHDAVGGGLVDTVTIRFRTDARACGKPFSVTSRPVGRGLARPQLGELRLDRRTRSCRSASQTGDASDSASPKRMRRRCTACAAAPPCARGVSGATRVDASSCAVSRTPPSAAVALEQLVGGGGPHVPAP